MPGALDGVRVVELAMWVAGPSAGAILADWGAEVIKIEAPSGDPLRAVFRNNSNDERLMSNDNRGKRGVMLDLRQSEDRAAALSLVGSADVFLTSLRTDALKRLGLDHETLLARDRRLVYALITGYGLAGPDAGAGAYDMGAFWARSGIADRVRVPGHELPVQPNAMGDHMTGLTAAGMVSAALLSRERTGIGQLVTTSLLRNAAYLLGGEISHVVTVGRERPVVSRLDAPNPLWNNYRAADGQAFWLIALDSDRQWSATTRVVERPEWEHDERFRSMSRRRENGRILVELLDEVFAARSRAEWATRFAAEKDFFWAPVNTLAAVLADPQFQASGALVEVEDGSLEPPVIASPADFHGTPVRVRTRAPLIGEHTDEVLRDVQPTSAHTSA